MIKTRDHFIEFAYHTFRNIKDQIFPLLVLSISLLGEKNKLTPYVETGFYLLIAYIIIYSFLKWRNKFFEFQTDKIRVSEGVFAKKSNDIPYSRVRSVNTSDTLFKRALGVSDLSIELIGGSKIVFVLKNSAIDRVTEELFGDINREQQKNSSRKFKLLEYFLISISNSKVFSACFYGTITLFTIVVSVLEKRGLIPQDEELNDSGMLSSIQSGDFNLMSSLVSTIVLILAIAIVSYLFCFIFVYFIYGNFRIQTIMENTQIEYGILNKKRYTIPKKQIRSLEIREPLMYRLFGYVQLRVHNIGLKKKSASTVMVNPILKKDELRLFLEEHLPDFKDQTIEHQPVTESRIVFMSLQVFYLLVITGILGIYHLNFFYLLFLVPIAVIIGNLKWKHSGLTFNDEYITIRKMNWTSRSTIISMKKFVQVTSVQQSVFMKKNELYHCLVSLYSEDLDETYRCNFLKEPIKRDFLNYLEPK